MTVWNHFKKTFLARLKPNLVFNKVNQYYNLKLCKI